MRVFLPTIMLAFVMHAVPVHAELGIGGFSRAGQNGVPLRIFDPDADGTAPPSYEMSGPTMGARDTQWATHEPIEQLYASRISTARRSASTRPSPVATSRRCAY
ncbi:MAG: hypothetical protein IPH43_14920 [Xanthomonadales bacterium]|nr:hypothetical protein [Xanthomonadales bacterium]